MNFILRNKNEIEKNHYIRKAARKNNYWGDFTHDKVLEYIRKYGIDFCFIVYGDEDIEDDFFVFPWSETSKTIFTDNNLEFNLSRTGKKPRNRWHFSIKERNSEFYIHFTKAVVDINITKYYSNKSYLKKIIFPEVKLNNIIDLDNYNKKLLEDQDIASKLAINELEFIARNAPKNPLKINVSVPRYTRNQFIVRLVKINANGICQLCGNRAPFNNSDGTPYLETHHIIWLSRGGEDSIENTVALCPNCHRKVHILDLKEDILKLQAMKK